MLLEGGKKPEFGVVKVSCKKDFFRQ